MKEFLGFGGPRSSNYEAGITRLHGATAHRPVRFLKE
jgi:hypothetical protein